MKTIQFAALSAILFFTCSAAAQGTNVGYYRLPNQNTYLKYKAYASKGAKPKTGKFLLRLCNTNQFPVSLVVCAMLDLENGQTVSQPNYLITKGASSWTCRRDGSVNAIYNYHFGCKQVTVPAASAATPETNIDVFKENVTFSIDFTAEELGTVYMDFLADCPVDASCTNFIGADKMLVPENPARHQQYWVNTWVGGEYFRAHPIPPELMFANNPARVPSGNWVTMGYAANYPARVIGTLYGAPAGSEVVVSFNGQARPAYLVPANPGGETALVINEAFTIPPGIAYDEINVRTPASFTNSVTEGARMTFDGQVFAEPGAPHYAPGDLMYHWDLAWVHDNFPPEILYDSITQVNDTVRAQVEARDASSIPLDATLVYNSPETGEHSVPLDFSDPAMEGDVVHFLSYVLGLPFGIDLNVHINVHDAFGRVASSPVESLYLFGARVAIQRQGANAMISWTTSDPAMLLTYNPLLGRRNPWRQVEGPVAFQNGVYSMVVPIANFPRFFQLQSGLETPCAGGELLVRQAYSVCNPDGYWHVVEDAYYACPPNGEVRKFRVGDTKTEQVCTNGVAAPAIAGNVFRQLEGDETCIAPKLIGDIRILECVGGVWEIAIYYMYECLDGTRRISIPARARTRTNTPCDQPPPPPTFI